jgi:hypothetical protein
MPVQGHYMLGFFLKQERAIKWIRAAFENAMQFPMNWAALFGSRTPKCSHFIAVPIAFLTGKDRTANLGSEQGWLGFTMGCFWETIFNFVKLGTH